jgi:hypothetical protein
MPIVALPEQRHSIQDEGFSFKVIIPSRKNYFAMIFLGIWLTGWAFGEIMVGGIFLAGIVQLFFKTPAILPAVGQSGVAGLFGGGLFMLVWLAGWTVGGGYALYTFLWQLTGKENIEVSYDLIKIQRALFGLGRTREYAATHIKNLRVTPWGADQNIFGRSRASSVWGISGGLLAFDYGAKTFRFGAGVDEAEAKQILEEIVARFPQYRVPSMEAV